MNIFRKIRLLITKKIISWKIKKKSNQEFRKLKRLNLSLRYNRTVITNKIMKLRLIHIRFKMKNNNKKNLAII